MLYFKHKYCQPKSLQSQRFKGCFQSGQELCSLNCNVNENIKELKILWCKYN